MAKPTKTPDIVRDHVYGKTRSTEKEEHESYGTILLTRCSGRANLFDVSSPQQHFISLTIKEAYRYRSLSNDRIHSQQNLIEVWMSETQFARMLSSIGVGEGVPVTIHQVTGDEKHYRDPPPMDDKGAKLKADMKTSTQYASDLLKELDKKLTALTEAKRISKPAVREVQNLMYHARMEIDSNMPFILDQAVEQLEGAVSEARANIDAYQKHRAMELGIGVVRDTVKELEDDEIMDVAKELQEGDDE